MQTPQNLNIKIDNDPSGVIGAALTNAIYTARLYYFHKGIGKSEEDIDKEVLAMFGRIAGAVSEAGKKKK